MESFFHATVLSNLARGYDKYARAYDKARIPESTYPDEFYVLPPGDLAIGARKAGALLARLAIAGDTLIALHTRMPADRLAPNPRTGLGLVWPASTLPIDGLHELAADGTLGAPIAIDDAMARSLHLHEHAFVPFAELRPRSISFLPIAKGCQAACPFCFSDASVSADQRQRPLDLALASQWLARAAAHGAERAVITGGGEPTLLPRPQLRALITACRTQLPKVVLITNGIALAAPDPIANLRELADAGLSVLAVSRHHPDEARNAEIMRIANHTPTIAAAIASVPGLRLRLVCVLQQHAVDSVEAIDAYVRWAASLGAHEVCFKELYVSTSHESVFHARASNAWSDRNQVPLAHVLAWAAASNFHERARLPWGAPIFTGSIAGHPIDVAAYTEPSLYWERRHCIARSWNVMSDGTCYPSLEGRFHFSHLSSAKLARSLDREGRSSH